MVSKRRRDDSLKRKPAFRSPKRRILVVCEGRETERRYIEEFQHEVHNPRVHVRVADETGVPFTVVTCAIRLRDDAEQESKRLRDENIRWDEVWGAFDVDEHPKLRESIDLAQTNNIQLAISNPCFELWALLHFQEQRAHVNRDKLRALLKKHLPDYEKTLEFQKMHAGYAIAVERAMQLDTAASENGSPGANPTTGIYRLTEAIKNT